MLAPFVARAADESIPVIHKRVNAVQMTLVATDRDRRPLRNLSEADIAVAEDGKAVSHFRLHTTSDLPLHIGLVLDLSDSTIKSRGIERAVLMQSMQQMSQGKDKLLLVGFNSKIVEERAITGPASVADALESPASAGLTALYDAIYRVCKHDIFVKNEEPYRSAMILFSDGEDDLSLHLLNEAIDQAELNGVSIYTISHHNPKLSTQGDTMLHNIATATGGRDFVVDNGPQLQAALREIDAELRTSYILYYQSPDQLDGRVFRRVTVSPTRDNGAELRLRTGYFTAP